MNDNSKKFVSKARSWSQKQGLHGPGAFLKYVVFTFTESLSKVSDDFVLKGGNLLWYYIKTPRATVDIDFATQSLDSVDHVVKLVEEASKFSDGISFKVVKVNTILPEKGVNLIVEYTTDDNAKNRFDIDIVFCLEGNYTKVSSPINKDNQFRASTIEMIVADKLAAMHRYGSGNSRMKDIDDLYRIFSETIEIDHKILDKILEKMKVSKNLNQSWINPAMEKSWQKHCQRYKDLPKDLKTVFKFVNDALKSIA